MESTYSCTYIWFWGTWKSSAPLLSYSCARKISACSGRIRSSIATSTRWLRWNFQVVECLVDQLSGRCQFRFGHKSHSRGKPGNWYNSIREEGIGLSLLQSMFNQLFLPDRRDTMLRNNGAWHVFPSLPLPWPWPCSLPACPSGLVEQEESPISHHSIGLY